MQFTNLQMVNEKIINITSKKKNKKKHLPQNQKPFFTYQTGK